MTRVNIHIWMDKTEDMFWCFRASCLKQFAVGFYFLFYFFRNERKTRHSRFLKVTCNSKPYPNNFKLYGKSMCIHVPHFTLRFILSDYNV